MRDFCALDARAFASECRDPLCVSPPSGKHPAAAGCVPVVRLVRPASSVWNLISDPARLNRWLVGADAVPPRASSLLRIPRFLSPAARALLRFAGRPGDPVRALTSHPRRRPARKCSAGKRSSCSPPLLFLALRTPAHGPSAHRSAPLCPCETPCTAPLLRSSNVFHCSAGPDALACAAAAAEFGSGLIDTLERWWRKVQGVHSTLPPVWPESVDSCHVVCGVRSSPSPTVSWSDCLLVRLPPGPTDSARSTRSAERSSAGAAEQQNEPQVTVDLAQSDSSAPHPG